MTSDALPPLPADPDDAVPSIGHERANQAHWDRTSDRYQAGHGAWIAAAPAAWGAWRIPEATVRLLPDVAGKTVLELGCALPYGEWVQRFRVHGLAIEALMESAPPPSVVSPFYPGATAWAQRWPAELLWKCRREA